MCSSCILSQKRKLWKDILELKKNFDDEEWCLYSDFNSVVNPNKMKGSLIYNRSTEMRDFKGFIKHINIINLLCRGNKFRWFSGDGNSMSRNDRFLVSRILIN